jgi:FKBP-type peptidyl-prolyl cis-trans isomerase
MMKSPFIRSHVILWAMLGLLLATGCKEEDDGDEKRAQEQRFFDLYISSTFKDTIPPPTGSGLYYIEVTRGTGEMPDSDDWMIVNYVGYTLPNELVVDTYLENVSRSEGLNNSEALYGPFKMQNGSRVEGLTEGMQLMREGGEAIICFSSDLGYGVKGTQLMEGVPGYTSMKYEIELVEVIKDIEAYELAKIEAFVDTITGTDTIHDPGTDAVMYFVVDEEAPDSARVMNDSLVQVAYRGYLPDGREFDKSAEGEPLEFTVGENSSGIIAGWQLGVTKFRKGEKGRLIIPYQLAYGEEGKLTKALNYYIIQPFETLVFDIEIVSVGGTESELEP